MIKNLLKIALCSGIIIGAIIPNEALSMQNVQKDEDVITKNI